MEIAEHFPPRTTLRVHLRGEKRTYDAEAKVVWVRPHRRGDGAGILHGLKFTRVSPEVRESLLILLILAGVARPAGVRLQYEVPVTCWSSTRPELPLHGQTRDISRGGLLLRLPRALPPNTAARLRLHTPNGPLAAEGSIVWVAPLEGRTPGGPIRHGLRFTSISWKDLLSLAPLLTAG